MKIKQKRLKKNGSESRPLPLSLQKKKVPNQIRNKKGPKPANLCKIESNEEISNSKFNEVSIFNNSFFSNKENFPISYNGNEIIYKNTEQISSNNYISYPLQENNKHSCCLFDPVQCLNIESDNLIKTESINYNYNVDVCPSIVRLVGDDVEAIDEESSDDEFEFILEQELIKEQIKRNTSMSSNNDAYISTLVEGVNNEISLEEQGNLILNAIRTNRKLADFCVTLEAALVKKLDKITKEFQHLKVDCTIPVDDGDTIVSRGFYSQFGAPYFKDSSGFYCPRNQDFKDKLSKNQFIGYLYMQTDHTADITALSNAIREYIIDDYVKKSNFESLKKRCSEVDNLAEQEVFSKEISYIKSKVAFMKSVDLKFLVKDISDSDIDWMKISSKESLDILTPGECLRYWNLILSPKVNRGPWSQQEKKELKKLAMVFRYQNWDKIAELLNTKRTGYQCFIQFKKHFGMVDFNRGRWSKKEDIQLSYLVSISEQGGVIGWAKVLCHLEDRTMAQALNRWYRLDPGLKKGKFTDEEDIILVNAVEQFGLDFQKVASVFPNRSAIQLRERYFAKRDMKVNKCGEWSLAEDKLLMDLIGVHGERKWSKIAENFPSRNRIQIRHRYKCIKLNLQKDPGFKLENLNRFKRNTHVNAKNKRDEAAISKSTAIDIISKTIEEGKIFYNKRRILKRTGRLKERG
ncbi:snRNA-activating protein complex subunit 4 [Halyomorpha halys]|uniref:snRNA-activating protein complex subunit 4 n=1 Tax=Halyomorpha halys TaxID=286706 RepID=UPI0006D4CBE4|nr:snRNA-activating protein complex subunit 4 [Halyomorpha halys]